MLGRIGKSVFGDKCERKNKNNLWNDLNSINDNTEKIRFLLDTKTKETHPNLEKDMEKLAKYKDFPECPDDVNLEAAKLVVAHKNAIFERDELRMGHNNTLAYPQFTNDELASEDFIIEKIQEKQPTAGGKKRKYKRKTNKRKTNKKKTNKRKTYKKRTKK